MNTKGDDAKFKRRLEKKNDFHFIEHWEEGKRPFDWYAEWRPLFACIYEVQVTGTFNVLEKEFSIDLESDLTRSTPPGTKADLSAEEREKYVDFINEMPWSEKREETEEEAEKRKQWINVFNKRFRLPDQRREHAIRGKVSLEDDRGLGLIADGEEPPAHFPRSGKGTITIRAVDGYHLGAIGFVEEDDLKWGWAGESQAGDLWFEFYVPEEAFSGIAERIRDIGPNAVCIARVSALVFQGEVDRSLAEPYHPQTFFLEKEEYSTMGKAILESVQVATPKPIGSEPIQGYRNHAIGFELDEDEDEKSDRPHSAKQSSSQSEQLEKLVTRSQEPIRLWPVTLALWAVFFGLVLNAIQ